MKTTAAIKPLPGNLDLYLQASSFSLTQGPAFFSLLVYCRSSASPRRIASIVHTPEADFMDVLMDALDLLRRDHAFHTRFHYHRHRLPDVTFG